MSEKSKCVLRPGIGLCDDCCQPKYPQVDAGYGIMICLDCAGGNRIDSIAAKELSFEPLKCPECGAAVRKDGGFC